MALASGYTLGYGHGLQLLKTLLSHFDKLHQLPEWYAVAITVNKTMISS